jgi:CRP/FNR family transcriptional regulator, cyclic AMP receptor protein
MEAPFAAVGFSAYNGTHTIRSRRFFESNTSRLSRALMGQAEKADSPAPLELRRTNGLPPKETPDRVSILATLKKIPLFQDLTLKELRRIEESLYLRRYRPDESIFREGEPGLGMYIVHKGSVWIQGANESESAASEPALELGPGDIFGEAALLEEQVHRVSARARTHTELLGFFRPDFTALNYYNPCLGSKLLVSLGRVISRRSQLSPTGSKEE